MLKLLGLFLLSSCFYCSPRAYLPEKYSFPKIANSDYRGLLFTAHKGYESSLIYWYNFKTGIVKEITRGESGDPQLFQIKDKVLLFNRKGNQLNYLTLDSQNDFKRSPAIPLSLSIGDPHSLLQINKNTVLLSCPSEHALKILNLKTGQVTTFYKNKEKDSYFFPGNFILKHHEQGDSSLYTLSRGQGKAYSVDDSQKLYRFPINKDFKLSNSPKKIKTNSTFSDTLFQNLNDKNQLFSFSFNYNSEGKEKSSFDLISLSDKDNITIEQISSLEEFPQFIKWGSEVQGEDNKFYVPLKNEKLNVIEVRSFSFLGNRKIESKLLHTFSSKNAHPPLLIYDKSTKCLFIGESSPETNGELHIYCNDNKESKKTGNLDLHPYNGVLIP